MKNGSIKKLIVIVPIFVALALLASCITVPMEMEETTKGTEDNEENSGIKWEMEDGGTLHIYGNGNMDNYYGQYLAPWDAYKKGIQKIVIDEGVMSIGIGAFSQCSGLREIDIPESVMFIDNYAFSGCTGLKKIIIPKSVTAIGNFTFRYCSGLKEITIPESVTVIGDYAFSECSGLKEITIPESVTIIGSGAFEGSGSLTAICGKSGSYAEAYAAEHGYAFEEK